jgi:TolA-binding protein
MMKKIFIFLLFLFLAVPLSSAYNCTALQGEAYNVCNYIEGTSWSESQKNSLIEELISNGGSLNGNFNSMKENQELNVVQLNELQEEELKISPENKALLIDLSSLSLMGYFLFAILKRSKAFLKL